MFGNLEVNIGPFGSKFACSETTKDRSPTLMEDQRSSIQFDNARANMQAIRMGNPINYAMSNQWSCQEPSTMEHGGLEGRIFCCKRCSSI